MTHNVPFLLISRSGDVSFKTKQTNPGHGSGSGSVTMAKKQPTQSHNLLGSGNFPQMQQKYSKQQTTCCDLGPKKMNQQIRKHNAKSQRTATHTKTGRQI